MMYIFKAIKQSFFILVPDMDKLEKYASTGDPIHLMDNHCFYPLYQFLNGGLFFTPETRHDFIRAIIYWDLHTTLFWTSWTPRNLAQYCLARKHLKELYEFDSMFMNPYPTEKPTEGHSNIPTPKIDLIPRYLEDLCDYVQEMELPTLLLETESTHLHGFDDADNLKTDDVKNTDSDKRPPHTGWEDTIDPTETPEVPVKRRGRPRKQKITVRESDLTSSSFHLM